MVIQRWTSRGVEKNNKWGFIDKSGATVIDLKYGQVNNFIEGYACVEKMASMDLLTKMASRSSTVNMKQPSHLRTVQRGYSVRENGFI